LPSLPPDAEIRPPFCSLDYLLIGQVSLPTIPMAWSTPHQKARKGYPPLPPLFRKTHHPLLPGQEGGTTFQSGNALRGPWIGHTACSVDGEKLSQQSRKEKAVFFNSVQEKSDLS
jgi:hypothetical protein